MAELRARRFGALLCALPLGLLAACGTGDDGSGPAIDWYDATSAPDMLAAAGEAMAPVTSVHVVQRARASDRTVLKDLSVAEDGTCSGSLQLPAWSEPAELVSSEGTAAFRGTEAFWLGFDLPGAGADEPAGTDTGTDPPTDPPTDPDALHLALAEAYADTWVTTPGLEALCDTDEFLGPIARAVVDGAGAPEEVAKAGLGDVGGRPTARVRLPRGDAVVTLWIEVAAPHRVLRLDVADSAETAPLSVTGDSTTTYADLDVPVTVELPGADEIVDFTVPDVG